MLCCCVLLPLCSCCYLVDHVAIAAAAAAAHCAACLLQVLRCGKWQRFRQGEVLYNLSDGEPMRLHLLYKVCLKSWPADFDCRCHTLTCLVSEDGGAGTMRITGQCGFTADCKVPAMRPCSPLTLLN